MRSNDDMAWQALVNDFCRSAAKHILKGVPFAELRARMSPRVDLLLDPLGIPVEARVAGLRDAMATSLCMEIWNATPIPENRFRPRKLAKPERNAPCPCGSGQKFKQCCAQLPNIDLGITEEVMLSLVLELLPQKVLADLPLTELHPDALAMVSQNWLEEGQAKKAISLLERYFLHLDKLDSRAEFAADTLLNAYLDAGAPRKKQKFVDQLKHAPDRDLRSCGWQRQATICSDHRDYPGAWDAFREAQRQSPNAPALSHLEILLLLSEGRSSEAKSRADFWIARLQRDGKHDHSELIEALRNMVGNDPGQLKTLQLTHGPLGLLANTIAHWPAPACFYQLLGGGELKAKSQIAQLEKSWMALRDIGDLDKALGFVAQYPLASQSFLILHDLSEMATMLDGGIPGSDKAVSRQLVQRAEILRQTVLGKLNAQNQELPWGFLKNRPMLTLVGYYVDDFADERRDECLDLMRWSITVANPTDNTGLREHLIHDLISAGRPAEAIAIAAIYPNDFASTEYGRVLAYFAAGDLAKAEDALKKSVERFPKVWKMLHATNPKMPRSKNPGYITIGGEDEAWNYRASHLDLWRSSGALKWGAGIRLSTSTKKKVPTNDTQNTLF